MNGQRSMCRWGGMVAGVALGLLAGSPAWAQGGNAVVADSPYANSDGPTIYKGQTYYPYGSNNDYGGFGDGLPIFRFSRPGAASGGRSGGWGRRRTAGSAAAPEATRPVMASAPYLTSQTYEPGDGWRYPLYCNPATGGYFYYPVAR